MPLPDEINFQGCDPDTMPPFDILDADTGENIGARIPIVRANQREGWYDRLVSNPDGTYRYDEATSDIATERVSAAIRFAPKPVES